MNDQDKALMYLVSIEKLAQQILADKKEIVLLDIQRNDNRLALKCLKNSNEKKTWITIGCILVKKSTESAISLLEADQIQLDMDINKLRSNLKIKVNDLRDLEMQPPVSGLMLVPMTQREVKGFSSAGLIKGSRN